MNLISSRANATNNNAYNCYYWHDQEVRIWSRHSDHWGRGTSPSPTGCRSCSASVHIWIDVLKGFKILKLQQIILIMSLNEIWNKWIGSFLCRWFLYRFEYRNIKAQCTLYGRHFLLLRWRRGFKILSQFWLKTSVIVFNFSKVYPYTCRNKYS